MNRATAIVFLTLLLVTTAGSMLPRFGVLPPIVEQNVVEAGIDQADIYTSMSRPGTSRLN